MRSELKVAYILYMWNTEWIGLNWMVQVVCTLKEKNIHAIRCSKKSLVCALAKCFRKIPLDDAGGQVSRHTAKT